MQGLGYTFTTESVEIRASSVGAESESLHLVIPVISQHDEVVEHIDPKTIRISKAKGNLIIRTNARDGFDNRTDERTFNLVPGFECLPLTVKPQREQGVSVQFSVEASSKSSPKAADSA